MKSIAEVLYGARNRITEFDSWTQGTLAKDKDGNSVQPGDPAARQWCAIGALAAEFPELDLNRAETPHMDKLSVLLQAKNALIAVSGGSIMNINDLGRSRNQRRNHRAVLRCFDHASRRLALRKAFEDNEL